MSQTVTPEQRAEVARLMMLRLIDQAQHEAMPAVEFIRAVAEIGLCAYCTATRPTQDEFAAAGREMLVGAWVTHNIEPTDDDLLRAVLDDPSVIDGAIEWGVAEARKRTDGGTRHG